MIRYGVIGTGMMGVEHIENINALDGAQVTAISDPVESSRQAGLLAAAAGGAPVEVFADHRDLLSADVVDAVVVASPNFTHVDVMDDVLDAGVHVLCEKPLTTTVDDSVRLIDKAAQTGGTEDDRIVWVGLEYRYMAAVDLLVREVRAGTVGAPRMVSIREHRFPFLPKVGDWNRLNINTGGTLVEKCCHFFDLMSVIVGERPSSVMASGGQDVNHLDEVVDGAASDILDNAFVIVDFPSGARAMLDLCMFADATEDQEVISVAGELGKVEARVPSNVVVVGRRGIHWIGDVERHTPDESHIAHTGLHHGSSYVEHARFLAAVRGDGPVEVTLEDGLWSVATGAAAQLSIAEGRRVDLSEFVPPSL